MTTPTAHDLAIETLKASLEAARNRFTAEGASIISDPDRFLETAAEEITRREADLPKDAAMLVLTHGIETISEHFDENGVGLGGMIENDQDVELHSLSYLNVGEVYRSTIVIDLGTGEAYVGSYGDWIENRTAFIAEPTAARPAPTPGL